MPDNISFNVLDLIGEGEEWIIDVFGNPIAIFYNGNFVGEIKKVDNTLTLTHIIYEKN